MKERPILFSAPMVRALLDGSKTQTRRICKNKIYGNGIRFDGNEFLCHNDYLPPSATLMDVKRGGAEYVTSDHEGWESECPHGQYGDRLWAREAWSTHESFDRYAPSELTHLRSFHYWADGDAVTGKKRPSIHMPRWASRITLEIVSVRVERLQACNEVDAIAEGAPWSACGSPQEGSHKAGYAQLWEQINGPGSWDANPWVWVIEFKKVES